MTRKATGADAAGVVPPATPPVFLERQSYRRRRLMDAARLLPLIGALVFAVPLLWPNPGGRAAGGGERVEPVAMSDAIIYVFSAWGVLIGVSFVFGIAARLWAGSDSPHRPGQG